jgi:DNA polymerase-3 subunit delta'
VLFSKVIGHATLKAKLIGNIREGRVAHAQLFMGPRGSGNLPLALAYAQYLLCEHRDEVDACGKCNSCVQMGNMAHPDVLTMFPSVLSSKARAHDGYSQYQREWAEQLKEWRNVVKQEAYLDEYFWYEQLDGETKQGLIGNWESVDILRFLSRKSMMGGYKVVLIWMPSRMNLTCANKLLKLLEEPEPMNSIILVEELVGQLLPTVISRTQLVRVPALPPVDVAKALRERFGRLSPDEAMAIALRSEGDLLEAVEMADNSEEELFIFFRDWLRACFRKEVVAAVEFADAFQKLGRERQKSLFRYGLYMIRQCALHWQQVPELVRVVGQEQEFVQGFSKVLNDRNLEGIRMELETAHGHVERNANPKVLFMDLSYRLMGLLKLPR